MTISKHKNGATYEYDFTIKGTRYRGSTGLTTKAKAREFEEREKRKVRERIALGIVSEITLHEAIKLYGKMVINQKPKTKDGKLTDSNKNAVGRLKHLQLEFGPDTIASKLSKGEGVSEYKERRLEEDEVSNSTVRRDLGLLVAVLNFAVKEKKLAVPPTIELPPENPPKDYYLTKKEEKELLECCPEYLRPLIEFYIDTGARKSCAINLTWDDLFEWKNGEPTMARFPKPKGGKPYSVPLPERTRKNLKRLQNMRSDKFDNVFTWVPDQDYRNKKGDLVHAKGELAAIGDFKKAWATARTSAGLSVVRVHDLRHTYASKLVQRGVSLYKVKELMGHSSIKQTERYAHLSVKNLVEAVNVLDD